MNYVMYNQVNRDGGVKPRKTNLVFTHDVVRGDIPGSVGGPLQRVPSGALLGARGELIIEHGGREYRLRRTSTGKLILTA
ncbi:MAG: hemin uptake protein HemP [Sulfuricaulis sp.]|uniref:hemin uptake protein HemP n=1 Tax=Sulfuricaulis sp. TaxID=2003553 RepID=UPI0034A104C1